MKIVRTNLSSIVCKRFIIKSLQTGFDLVEDDDTYDLITEWQQHKREAKMCRTASLKSRLLQGSKMFKASINKWPFLLEQLFLQIVCFDFLVEMFLWTCKGQLILEWIYEVIVSPKMRTKNCQGFCPVLWGQKFWQFFICLLGETMTS